MEHIGKLLSRNIRQSGLAKQVETALVIEEFTNIIIDIFGANVSKRIRPLFIKNKSLTAVCLSSVIAQEINFKKQELIDRLNKKFGQEVLKEIRFRF